MNLKDLERICNRYVPEKSRHSNSWAGSDWWHAHEIGHLLVAKPCDIGLPLFGFDIDVQDQDVLRVALLTECAAMTVSRKLLIRCGDEDLADMEAEDTDVNTMDWWYDHAKAVRKFCVTRGVARIPRTTDGLVAMVRRKVGL